MRRVLVKASGPSLSPCSQPPLSSRLLNRDFPASPTVIAEPQSLDLTLAQHRSQECLPSKQTEAWMNGQTVA